MNLKIIVGVLKAFQKEKQRNLYQLFYIDRILGSKKTLVKYLHKFVDRGLLGQKDGKQHGNIREKIYFLTEKGKEAFQLSNELLTMLED